MKPRQVSTLVGLVLSGVIAGCNLPHFKSSIEPLELPDAPPQPGFGQVEPGQPPPALEPESQPPQVIEPAPFEPKLVAFCTTTLMYIRSSPGKPVGEDNSMGLLPPGTPVTWTGNEAQALADDEMLTWYEIDTETGTRGWSAESFLAPGECGQSSIPGGFPRILDAPGYSGSEWLGETANCEGCTHYGVDVASGSGDSSIYAPWVGEVVGYDNCDGCPEGQGNTYNLENPTDEAYNWGYGATAIVEYAYDAMNGADLQRLRDGGIDLQPGESLYVMFTHLDRQVDNAQAGTALSPGEVVSVMDNSGNSEGPHAHVEAAISASGHSQEAGTSVFGLWWNTIVEVDWSAETIEGRQGNRVDPTGLFNLP